MRWQHTASASMVTTRPSTLCSARSWHHSRRTAMLVRAGQRRVRPCAAVLSVCIFIHPQPPLSSPLCYHNRHHRTTSCTQHTLHYAATKATTLPQMSQLRRRVWHIDLSACPRHRLHCLWLWRSICQPAPRVLHHHTQRVLLQRGPVPQCRARAVSVQAAPQL